MKRPGSVFDGFFSDDVERVAEAHRALHEPKGPSIDRSWGAITDADQRALCQERDGQFAHIEVSCAIHPLLVPHVAHALSLAQNDVERVITLEPYADVCNAAASLTTTTGASFTTTGH